MLQAQTPSSEEQHEHAQQTQQSATRGGAAIHVTFAHRRTRAKLAVQRACAAAARAKARATHLDERAAARRASARAHAVRERARVLEERAITRVLLRILRELDADDARRVRRRDAAHLRRATPRRRRQSPSQRRRGACRRRVDERRRAAQKLAGEVTMTGPARRDAGCADSSVLAACVHGFVLRAVFDFGRCRLS